MHSLVHILLVCKAPTPKVAVADSAAAVTMGNQRYEAPSCTNFARSFC